MIARWIAVAAFTAIAEPAAAHTVFGFTGFSGGLLHPLVVPAHLMTVAALGLLIGRQGWVCGVAIIYAVAVCVGLGLVALGIVPTLAEATLLAASATIGLLVAWGRAVPWMIGAGLAAVVGFALALDSPPQAISLMEANLTLLGTALSAVILLVAVTKGASCLQRHWQRIGARILGSWIAASAILVLALRLLR